MRLLLVSRESIQAPRCTAVGSNGSYASVSHRSKVFKDNHALNNQQLSNTLGLIIEVHQK